MDCHDVPEIWIDTCRQCENSKYSNCTADACQCIDKAEPQEKPHKIISIHLRDSHDKRAKGGT